MKVASGQSMLKMLKVDQHMASGNNHKLSVFTVMLSRFYTAFPFLPWCPAPIIDVERAALYVHVSLIHHKEKEQKL